MTPEQKARIADAQATVDMLTHDLEAAKDALKTAKLDALDINVGDIVKSKGTEYRVTFIDVRWWNGDGDHPWLRGVPRKKDGTFGVREFALYREWVKV